MGRIKLITPAGETSVGMIYSDNEALQVAALLQALCTTPNYVYWVETGTGQNKKRKQPEPLQEMIGKIKPLHDLLMPLYIKE